MSSNQNKRPKSTFPLWTLIATGLIGVATYLGFRINDNLGLQPSNAPSQSQASSMVDNVPAQIDIPESLQYTFINGKPLASVVREVFVLNATQYDLIIAGKAPSSQEIQDIREKRDGIIAELIMSGLVSKLEVTEKDGLPLGITIEYNEGALNLPPIPDRKINPEQKDYGKGGRA